MHHTPSPPVLFDTYTVSRESIQTLVSTHKLTEFNNTAYPKHDDFTPEGKEYCDDSSSPTRKRSRQVSKPSSLDLDLVHSTSSSTSNSGTSSTQASRSPSPSYSPSYGRKSASSFQPSPPQSCPTSPRYSNYTPPSSPNQERKHEAKSQNTTPFAPHYSYQLPQKEPKLSLPTQVTSPPETTRLVVYHITSYKKDTHFTQMVSPHKPLDLDIPHSRRNQMNLDRYPIQHASPKQGPVPYLPSFQSLVAAIPFSYSMWLFTIKG